jgi:hypothetical protein
MTGRGAVSEFRLTQKSESICLRSCHITVIRLTLNIVNNTKCSQSKTCTWRKKLKLWYADSECSFWCRESCLRKCESLVYTQTKNCEHLESSVGDGLLYFLEIRQDNLRYPRKFPVGAPITRAGCVPSSHLVAAHYIFLRCDAVWSCRWVPTFRRNILPPSSGPTQAPIHWVTRLFPRG